MLHHKFAFIILWLDLGCWWSEHLFIVTNDYMHILFIFLLLLIFPLWILLHLPCCKFEVTGNCKKWKYSIFKNAIKFWIAIDLWTNCSNGSTKMVLATMLFVIDISMNNWNLVISWEVIDRKLKVVIEIWFDYFVRYFSWRMVNKNFYFM